MDPVIFSFELFGLTFSMYWYGLIIAIAVMIGAFVAEWEIKRRGGPEGHIWDLLIWVVPAGIVGARLWFVLNDIAGGGTYYTTSGWAWIHVWEGGLHIYGAVLGGLIAAYYYCRKNNFDMWMLLDSLATPLLIAQAFGRIANFINQELYGPPTDLAWGVKIAAENRIYPWTDLVTFPVETTRFHPTFFYKSLWNLVMAGLIIWITSKYMEKLKPGATFYMWLIAAGVGRVWLEFFRPDQPQIPGTDLSYSRLIAILMAIAGIVLLLSRLGVLKLAFKTGPKSYNTKDLKWKKKKTNKTN